MAFQKHKVASDLSPLLPASVANEMFYYQIY